jgi:hypothetical protein
VCLSLSLCLFLSLSLSFHHSDIDLLRDPSVLDNTYPDHTNPLTLTTITPSSQSLSLSAVNPHRWKCLHCSNHLNQEEIENRLIEEVEKLQALYLLQDFRCSKTHAISSRLATSLSPRCEPLVMDMSMEQMKEEMELLRQVASIHGYYYVLEMMEDWLV